LEVTEALALSSVSFPPQNAALVMAVPEVVLLELELELLPQAAIPSPATHTMITAGTTRSLDKSRPPRSGSDQQSRGCLRLSGPPSISPLAPRRYSVVRNLGGVDRSPTEHQIGLKGLPHDPPPVVEPVNL
jgi:hypothetical protein